MNEQTKGLRAPEDMEINLGSLFWSCLLRWRAVLISMLAFALALGAYKGVKTYLTINDPDYYRSMNETNRRLEEVYALNKKQLEDRMQSLSEEIEQQKAYMANSVLYNMDPYHVFVREVSYYVDTNYRILPEMGLQNPDYTGSVVEAYRTVAGQVNIDNVLYGDTEHAQGYDKRSEFITAAAGPNLGTLSIRVRGNNQEQADAIMAAIESAILEKRSFIRDTIADHEISVISDSRSQIADSTLIELHETNEAKMAALTDSYLNILNEYKNLKEPEYIQLGSHALRRSVIKNSVVGAVAGTAAAVVVISGLLLFRETVINEEEMNSRYDTAVFGTVTEGKRGRIDQWILGHLGVQGRERSAQIEMIAVKMRQRTEEKESLMLMGDVEAEKLERLAGELKANGVGVQRIAGKGHGESADTFLQLQQCGAVILVERMQRSSHRQVRSQMNMARQMGKKELGVILLV